MILDEIIADKRIELNTVKSVVPIDEVKEIAGYGSSPLDFKAVLMDEGINVIAEVKKASPSKGVIREDFDPVDIAAEYEDNGACAISVLTESNYFQGRLEYLSLVKDSVEIPVLRKDFIFDEYQIFESRAAGADALLLIASVLELSELKAFIKLTQDLKMSALVEVHTEEELGKTLDAGASIIGINNRDLKTFKTDIETTKRLVKLIPEGKVIVSESGINTVNDISGLREAGVDAFLIGEALMREASPGAKLKELILG